jgi:hypothetical protein
LILIAIKLDHFILKNKFKKILKYLGVFHFYVRCYDSYKEYRSYKTLIKRIKSIDKKSNLFFFFPFFHTGGAEKVHLEIVRCFPNENPIVFFTLESADNHFLNDFMTSSDVYQLYPLIKETGKYVDKITKVLFDKINSAQDSTVFSCHSLFFYNNMNLFNKNFYF